jgi:hypothetical protein
MGDGEMEDEGEGK